MAKFVGECPVEGCDFTGKSPWKNAARSAVILHIYRTDGRGHGPRGSRPEKNLETEVEEIDGE